MPDDKQDVKRRKRVLEENAETHAALIARRIKKHQRKIAAIPDDVWEQAEESDATELARRSVE